MLDRVVDAPMGGSPAEPLYVVDAARPRRLAAACEDVALGLRRWRLPWALALLDIRNRYRGSVLGPFWLTLSTAAMIAGLGLLYSSLLKLPLAEYLPFLGTSLVLWGLISQTVTDACTSFTAAEGIIRQLPLPFSVHVLRGVLRNAIAAAHSLPILLLVFLLCGALPGPAALLALPGLALLGLCAAALSLFLGMACARFRDTPAFRPLIDLYAAAAPGRPGPPRWVTRSWRTPG
jgi:lipopolysaccharide transport system permease protein